MPETNPTRPSLKLKPRYYESQVQQMPDTVTVPADVSVSDATAQRIKRDNARRRLQVFCIWAGWLIFVCLGGALVYFRFFAEPPWLTPAEFRNYGMISVGVVYVLAIMAALKNSMFDGLLALVVPLYPFYFLFFSSGSIFLRAVAAALLAGFGFDCANFIQEYAVAGIDKISYWIGHV